MKTSMTTKILLAFGAICLVWHIFIATSAKTKLAGLFLAKPGQPGYVWKDIGTTDSRFFWDLADLKWKTGLKHPDFNAMAGEQTGQWLPKPGYVFVDKTTDLTSIWLADQHHPDYMAVSGKSEGEWVPIPGYKFTYHDGELSGTNWDPNRRYDNLKIMSLTVQEQYKPYAGYQFIEPGKSLKVAWTPGLVSSDNRQLMAGAAEGTWVVANPSHPRYRAYEPDGKTFGKRLARRAATRATDRFVDRAVDRAFGF
jgi:hypothetical protein